MAKTPKLIKPINAPFEKVASAVVQPKPKNNNSKTKATEK